MKLNKKELSTIFDVTFLPDNYVFDSQKISIDTRNLKEREYFFAILGQSFDGNKFIDKAIEKGASLIISQKKIVNSIIPNLIYDNDRAVLSKLSTLILSKTEIPKYAITGSNGKTTTREILFSILNSKLLTLKPEGNFNNEIGLPLTIFKLKSGHRAIILELGMNRLGEIDQLAAIAKPHWSIITNVGRAHLKYLKNIENIAIAKCELIPHTKNAIIINKDSDLLLNQAKKYKKPLIYFSLFKEADIYMIKLIENSKNNTKFTFRDNINSENIEILLPLTGMHNISNYLAAYVTARISGFTRDEIVKATALIKSFSARFEIKEFSKLTIIKDCYNANPDSMIAGLKGFSNTKNSKNKIAILGDMLELGENEEMLHREIGKFFAELEIDKLITFGNLAKNIREGALEIGFKNSVSFEQYCDLVNHLNESITGNEILYIKGSNAMKLDRIFNDLNIIKGER